MQVLIFAFKELFSGSIEQTAPSPGVTLKRELTEIRLQFCQTCRATVMLCKLQRYVTRLFASFPNLSRNRNQRCRLENTCVKSRMTFYVLHRFFSYCAFYHLVWTLSRRIFTINVRENDVFVWYFLRALLVLSSSSTAVFISQTCGIPKARV